MADAAPEPQFCSNNLHGLLKSCKSFLGRDELCNTEGKICFLVFRLNKVTFHFTFLICTAKKQIDISKPFPNVYFKR